MGYYGDYASSYRDWGPQLRVGITNPQLIVEIAFVNNPTTPLASLTWTDVTHWCQDITTTMGRTHENNQTEVSRLTVRLVNIDGRFSPFNTASPYYGPFTDGSDTGVLGLVPIKRIRLRAVYDTITYNVWHGFVESWIQNWPNETERYVDVTATDALKLFNLRQLQTLYYETVAFDNPLLWLRLGDAALSTVAIPTNPGAVSAYVGIPSAGVTFGTTALIDLDSTTSASLVSPGNITVPNFTLPAGDFSVEAWVTTTGAAVPLIAHNYGAASPLDQWIVEITAGGAINFFVQNPFASTICISAPYNVIDGNRHHIACTFKASTSTGTIYIDGGLVASSIGTATGGATGPLYIGYDPLLPGSTMTGSVQDVAIYTSTLSGTRVMAHTNAGFSANAGQATGARINAILDFVGWPTADRNIAPGSTTLQGTRFGQSALAEINAVVTAEDGFFYVDGNGKATFRGRTYPLSASTANTSQITMGESGEPYELTGTVIAQDDYDVWNIVTAGRSGGVLQHAVDLTSQARYGQRSMPGQTGLQNNSDFDIWDRANYMLGRYSSPTMRASAIVVHPVSDPTVLFPQVLGRILLDRVTVTRNPETGTSVGYSQDAVIEKVSHTISRNGDWRTTWALSPADTASYWILNSSTKSVLDSTTKLFW